MAQKQIDVYLNDHLAGATLGRDLARLIEARSPSTPLAGLMHTLAPQIEEDRMTLLELMARMQTSRSLLKQASGWIAEKAARVKFRRLASGEHEIGTLMAVESLTLGVWGKLGLWKALSQQSERYPVLQEFELGQLAERAESQYELLEQERLAASRRAFHA